MSPSPPITPHSFRFNTSPIPSPSPPPPSPTYFPLSPSPLTPSSIPLMAHPTTLSFPTLFPPHVFPFQSHVHPSRPHTSPIHRPFPDLPHLRPVFPSRPSQPTLYLPSLLFSSRPSRHISLLSPLSTHPHQPFSRTPLYYQPLPSSCHSLHLSIFLSYFPLSPSPLTPSLLPISSPSHSPSLSRPTLLTFSPIPSTAAPLLSLPHPHNPPYPLPYFLSNLAPTTISSLPFSSSPPVASPIHHFSLPHLSAPLPTHPHSPFPLALPLPSTPPQTFPTPCHSLHLPISHTCVSHSRPPN